MSPHGPRIIANLPTFISKSYPNPPQQQPNGAQTYILYYTLYVYCSLEGSAALAEPYPPRRLQGGSCARKTAEQTQVLKTAPK